jgi:tetratricopeptide (TPR) repeat protein
MESYSEKVSGIMFAVLILGVLFNPLFAFADGDVPSNTYLQAISFYKTKNYESALPLFELEIKNNPGNARAYYYLGCCQYRNKDFKNSTLNFYLFNQKSSNSLIKDYADKLMATLSGDDQKWVLLTLNGPVPELSPSQDSKPINSQAGNSNNGNNVNSAKSNIDVSLVLSKNWWLRGYSGYDYSLLGDVINSITSFPKYFNSFDIPGYTITSNTGNSGIQAGIELGFLLDKNNGFSINAENVWSQSDSYTEIYSGTTNTTVSVTPNLASISLNYYRYLFQQKGSRTYIAAGIGYYQTSINYYDYDINGNLNPTTATFTGNTIGGTLGVGQMIGIGNSFGIEVSVHGRIATIAQVSSSSLNQGGTTLSGPFTLGVANEAGIPPTILIIPPGYSGSDVRNLVVDYSGFDANLSFDFYF